MLKYLYVYFILMDTDTRRESGGCGVYDMDCAARVCRPTEAGTLYQNVRQWAIINLYRQRTGLSFQ